MRPHRRLTWRVFKSNADGPMERKLAFEVTAAELLDPDTCDRALFLFSHLTPPMVSDGELTRLGTMVFVDGRVREALTTLLEEPHRGLVKLIRAAAGTDTDLKPADIKGALSRILPPVLDALAEADTIPGPVTARRQAPGPAPAAAKPEPATGGLRRKHHHYTADLKDLVAAGLPATPATLAPAHHGFADRRATLRDDGTILLDGAVHTSPSSAGKAILGGASNNGWKFWKVVDDPQGRTLADFRTEYLHRNNTP